MSRLKEFISQLFAPASSLDASSDEALLARYREGDGAAFEILYARHRQGLYRFLLGLSGRAELAEEVYQETWLSLIRSGSQPQGRATFRTWLYQIARNRLIDPSARATSPDEAEFHDGLDDELLSDAAQPHISLAEVPENIKAGAPERREHTVEKGLLSAAQLRLELISIQALLGG